MPHSHKMEYFKLILKLEIIAKDYEYQILAIILVLYILELLLSIHLVRLVVNGQYTKKAIER